ncbi:hypothetical protein [Frondihabitans australicus]|uniref:DUF4352 domain-containing protein n=1 Tax=Frondihabitans australicus TaxID=386892 RepID=A0A495IA88_9MICO|nr:hypothetical protein [Frondihabitans australicus]RKR72933.1 hypothetical protein C8E83_0014 [Frondihabitans australicus]
MSDNSSPQPAARRITRRGVIVVSAIVVVVALVVVFLIRSLDPSHDPAPSISQSVLPTPTPSSVYTPAPTTKAPAATGKVVTPTGTAKPGTQAKAVPLTATATPVSGVHVTLAHLQAVQGKGDGVGEISGPAIRFDVVFQNDTSAAIPLSSVVVNVTYGSSKTPADELTSNEKPLPASIDKGQSGTGTYTFTLPEADRSDVQITVDYHVGIPITVFSGSAPR